MQKKNGISLIVLVITIIVMIVLAGVIILSLSNSGVIEKTEEAVDETNLSEVQHLAALLWADEYLKQQEDGKIDQAALEAAVTTGLDKEKINLDDYIVTVTTTGVSVSIKENWVVATVDGVPIPKGFVASPYGEDTENGIKAENTKDGGLVIYELNEGETAIDTSKETQYDSWTKRNQYVWVPVNKDTFDTEFVRKDYINTTSYLSDTLGAENKYWEVVPTTEKTEENLQYMTERTLKEVQAMYASVKKYGGFYIARYEAGIDNHRTYKGNAADLPGIKEGTKVYSVMGKIPYTCIPWTWHRVTNEDTNGAVEVSRNLYLEDNSKNTTGVVSTLIYAVQWDRTLQWFIDTGAMSLDEINMTIGSAAYGNYEDHVIAKSDLNEGAQIWDYSTNNKGSYVSKDSSTLTYPKANGTRWALSTGALKAANINNIYDMAGNMMEWSTEGYSIDSYCHPGGNFLNTGDLAPISSRNGITPDSGDLFISFRPALYIKI